jgi:hypothetical protein
MSEKEVTNIYLNFLEFQKDTALKQHKTQLKDAQIKEIINQLKSGDLILFSGNQLVGSLIQIVTESKWTHCGLVLRGYYKFDIKENKLKKTKDERIYIIESNVNVLDFISGVGGSSKNGVSITSLHKRIKNINCELSFLLLNINIKEDINIKWDDNDDIKYNGEEIMWKWFKENKNRDYDYMMAFSIASTKDNRKEIFCSELVANIYKKLGIFPDMSLGNRFAPGDFMEYYKKGTKFKGKYKFDKLKNYKEIFQKVNSKVFIKRVIKYSKIN